jgi:hypothetical protein
VSNETSGIQFDASLLKQRRSETTDEPEAALLLPLLQIELRCLIHGEDERRDRLRATLLDNMVIGSFWKKSERWVRVKKCLREES